MTRWRAALLALAIGPLACAREDERQQCGCSGGTTPRYRSGETKGVNAESFSGSLSFGTTPIVVAVTDEYVNQSSDGRYRVDLSVHGATLELYELPGGEPEDAGLPTELDASADAEPPQRPPIVFLAFVELPQVRTLPAGPHSLGDLHLRAFYCDEGSLVREQRDFFCRTTELVPAQSQPLDGTLLLTDGYNFELALVGSAGRRIAFKLSSVSTHEWTERLYDGEECRY